MLQLLYLYNMYLSPHVMREKQSRRERDRQPTLKCNVETILSYHSIYLIIQFVAGNYNEVVLSGQAGFILGENWYG